MPISTHDIPNSTDGSSFSSQTSDFTDSITSNSHNSDSDHTSSDCIPSVVPLRQSTRARKLPSHLSSY